MVSVAIVKSRASAAQALARIVRALLLPALRYVRSLGAVGALRRAAAAGSLWATLVFAFGGFCEHSWQVPLVSLRVAYTVTLAIAEYIARGCKPLFEEWSLPFEISRAVVRCLMANYGDRVLNPKVAQFIRWECDVVGTAAGAFVSRHFGTKISPFHHNGLEHVWIRAAAPPPKPKRRVVVLYFHGGGFSVLSPRLYISFASQLHHRLRDRLGDKLGTHDDVEIDILLANYRKLPEHPHPAPVLDAVAMFDYVTKELGIPPRNVIIAGDSAGAGLSLATMLRVRDADPKRLPLAGFLLCPYVNLEPSEDDDERKAPYCVLGDRPNVAVTSAYHPREGPPTSWGDASPVHCDLRGLPPVYIQAAEFDLILPHAKRLMAKATHDGLTHWELEIFRNVPHVFTNFPSLILPSAARGIDAAAEYAATRFAHSMEAVAG